MDSALFRSPISRLIAGAVDVMSTILFMAVWVATLVTSGFSLTGTQTFAGWTYFPMFWPHLIAATLGVLMILRYGANFATASLTVLLWMVALVADAYGAVAYWRLFWLCDIGNKSQLTGVARGICDSENALLICMMVVGTVLLALSVCGIGGHGFDLFQAGRSGSASPGRTISAPLLWVGLANMFTLLAFSGLWLANWISTSTSVGGGQTYAVWTYANIFLIQLSASVLGSMMFVRYGANWVTAAVSIVLWSTSFFAALYGTALYWRIGWFCKVASVSSLSGNQLTICTQETSYLIALWVLASILWILSIIAPIAHAYDFFAAGRHGSVRVKLGASRRSDNHGVTPHEDLEMQNPPETEAKTPQNIDQYAPYNDGSVLSGARIVPLYQAVNQSPYLQPPHAVIGTNKFV